MAIPTLQDATSYRGALTKAGAAAVAMSDLMAATGSPTSWTITLSSGTSGHWTLPTDGTSPTPVTTGALGAGPYVFTVTATNAEGTSAPATLTIEIRADTYTISKITEIAGVTAGLDSRAALIAGRTLEFARHATDFDQATATIQFKFWRASAGNPCTIKHEDPNNPCPLGRIHLWRCAYLDFVSIRVTSARRGAGHWGAQFQWSISGKAATGAADCRNLRFFDTYGPCGGSGPENEPSEGIVGLYMALSPIIAVEFWNLTFTWVTNGIAYYDNILSDVTYHGRTVLRYITANGLRYATLPAGTVMHFDQFVVMSPIVDPAHPDVHCDVIQPQNGHDCSGVTIDLLQGILADGDLSATQGLFNREPDGEPGNYSLLGMTIGATEMCLRAANAYLVNGSDADHPFTGRHVTIMAQLSGPYGQDYYRDGGVIAANSPQWFVAPRARFGGGVVAANTVFEDAWVFGGTSAAGEDPAGATVLSGDGNFDVSAAFPNASWVCSQALKDVLDANSTVQNFLGVDDNRWHGTVDEVLEQVAIAFTPAAGGPLMNPDGTYIGSRFPDGTLNDGSVYNATAPTTITASANATVENGVGLLITYTLDQPATSEVTITPGSSGVAGSFSAVTVAIAIGAITGAVTFTPSATGDLVITGADDAGLTGPNTLNVTVTGPVAPTTYAQSPANINLLLGQSAEVSYTLNRAATSQVTITPALSGVSGSFNPATVVIAVGQTIGSTIFTPSSAGTATISATNDQALPNPPAATAVVSSTTRSSRKKIRLRWLK